MITEIEIRRNPRKYGKSNYNLLRTFRVTIDLFTISFLLRYEAQYFYIFGGTGMLFAGIGLTFGAVWLFFNLHARENIGIAVTSIFFIIAGIYLGAIGTELISRTYYETQNRKLYLVKK